MPQPRKRDPFFGLSRAWYYAAAKRGDIRVVSVRKRNALRGVTLVVYDSVAACIRRSAAAAGVELPPRPPN